MKACHKLLIVFIAGVLSSCVPGMLPKLSSGDAEEPVLVPLNPDNLITCEGIGPVKLSYSYQDLVEKFGAKSLSEHENSITGVYTTVWDSTEKQLNIYWKEKKKPFRTIDFIETGAALNPYVTADTIRVGMLKTELVQRNSGMPLTFVNFYALGDGGVIKSFNNGNIGTSTPCLSGKLEISGQRNVHVEEEKAFRKKEIIESFDPLLNRMEVTLVALRVYNK
jgi:hypothetical protein